jgi:adenylosuccinate lyase
LIHPIEYRYGTPEMRKIWDENARLEKMLAVEVALVDALRDLQKIPAEDAKNVKTAAKKVRPERVKELEQQTKHDVYALVKALAEESGPSGKWVHVTATSYDIVDTALALQLRDGLNLLLKDGDDLLKTLIMLSERHKALVMMGRTHGQHAIPITLGFKFANYADKLGHGMSRLKYDLDNFVAGKFSGAVGTYSAQKIYGLEGAQLEAKVMEHLGLKAAPITSQVVPRENLARIVGDVAIACSTVEQVAKEIRNLQRTEIGEVSEGFAKQQVGSSAMAQKHNPVDCENVCSNARIVRSAVLPALENIALEHERDLTNSAAERSTLPTVFLLADDMLVRMNKVLQNISVSRDAIKRNLGLSYGTVMAEAVMTLLVKKGVPRDEAHELMRIAANQAIARKKPFKQILAANKRVRKTLTKAELDKATDVNSYTGLAVEKTDQVVAKWKK